MSLTRKEWEEMWEEIGDIKLYYDNSTLDLAMPIKRRNKLSRNCQHAIDKIKDKIQQVIGQME